MSSRRSSGLVMVARLALLFVAAAPALAGSGAAPHGQITEREPRTESGWNDAITTAQPIQRPTQRCPVHVDGTLATESTPVTRISLDEIDDGSIPLAQSTPRAPFTQIVDASIGDGRQASAGDFDYYRVNVRAAGTITATVNADDGLNPAVALLDADGTVLAEADDRFSDTGAALVKAVGTPGAYFVVVMASGTAQGSVFDPASGRGAESKGDYELRLTAAVADVDTYAVLLRGADVLGVATTGSAKSVGIWDADGNKLAGSTSDAAARRPASSPLPSGDAAVEEVATRPGWYYIALTGARGSYDLVVSVSRPDDGPAGVRQRILLDFDGAVLDSSVFARTGLPLSSSPAPRSFAPLRQFLPRWGLRPADLVPLETAIADNVAKTLSATTLPVSAGCRRAILVSRRDEGATAWGAVGVSRVIIGGSIAETGLPTIGVAESVDPGNFDTTDTAVVLLDVLSSDAGEPYSINRFLTSRSDRIQFVAAVVGDYVLHEIGHLLGSWHSQTAGASPDLMDDTNIASAVAGADRVGGTADDVELTFRTDIPFSRREGLSGRQDSAGRVASAISNCS